MIAEEINKNDENDTDGRNSPSLTIRKVFFTYSSSPSSLFLPTLITAKGLHPPSLFLLNTLFLSPPLIKRSCSVPTKLITMQEHQETIIPSIQTTEIPKITITKAPLSSLPVPSSSKIKKSVSAPIIPTTKDTHIPVTDTLAKQIPTKTYKKSTPMNTLVSSLDTTSQKPRPSNSTGRSLHHPSSVQVESINSTPIKLTPKKKKFVPTLPLRIERRSKHPKKTTQEEEEDEPMTKPLSLAEKRKRQAKRADQVKIWKVREEREAREARLLLRRQMMNVPSRRNSNNNTEASTPSIPRKKKKRVKFNFDKNCVIQLPLSDNES